MSVETGRLELIRDFNLPTELVFAAGSQEKAQLAWGHPAKAGRMAFERFSFAVGKSDICRFAPDGGSNI